MPEERKIKVFHGMVNYGTQAGYFAQELRKNGVEAISVVVADPFKRRIDVELLYGGSLVQKILKHSWNLIRKIYWFFKYDTFHFYFGATLFPKQLDLPLYRLVGKKVIMEYLGDDAVLFDYSNKKYGKIPYYDRPKLEERDAHVVKRLNFEAKHTDLLLVCAPYISEFVPNSKVLPLGLDLAEFAFARKVIREKIVIMHAPTSKGFKGTDVILETLKKLISNGYSIEIKLVENVTHDQLKKHYQESDIFIDQIYAGWYGTAAIEAMASGCVVVCNYREDYFKYINYGKQIPIVNANKENIYSVLESLLNNRSKIASMKNESRKFVEEIHDIKVLTAKLLKYYRMIH
jgi:glycosyltransferase involved in cell wall biosynthesis